LWRAQVILERVVITVSHLDVRMCEFIARQEMVFVADAGGDSSSRAGPPGFVRVLGPRQLAWPEVRAVSRPGAVRLLFVDFFRSVMRLSVNGDATITDLGEERWVTVQVTDAYLQAPEPVRLACRRGAASAAQRGTARPGPVARA
jgi:hypothetical protein